MSDEKYGRDADIIDEFLAEYDKRYNIKERTLRSFWEVYTSYISEDPEEAGRFGLYDKSSVSADFIGLSYRCVPPENFSSAGCEVCAAVEMTRTSDGKKIGRYLFYTDLHGRVSDDVFFDSYDNYE